mgnify:FL=1|jgi:hypothetical protein
MSWTNIVLNIFLFFIFFTFVVPIGLLYRFINIFRVRKNSFYVKKNHSNSRSMKSQF